MLPLASSAVPLAGVLIIGGGIVTLVAAVATVASFTPTYKGLGWDGKAQRAGGLLAVPGLAAVFAGSTRQLTSHSAALTKVETGWRRHRLSIGRSCLRTSHCQQSKREAGSNAPAA
jgi:hypothetical protein